MKARKTAETISLCISIALILGTIGFNIYEKIEARKLHSDAVTAAQNYLKSKYGFNAAMSDETEYPARQKWLLKHSVYEFTSEYNEKTFYVWVNKSSDNDIRCKDSYQFDDIYSDIKNRLENEFPISFISNFWLGDNDEWQTGIALYGGFSDYYDGTNLNEIIMKNGKGTIKMCIAEDSFENSDIDKKLSDLNFTYCLTAFDTAEHLNEFKDFCGSGTSSFSDFIKYEYAAPYITEHIDNLSGEKTKLNIDLKYSGDFMYAYLPVENWNFPASENLDPPSKLDTNYFIDLFEFKGSKHEKAYDEREYVDTPVSEPWQFNCRYGDVMIYYPLDKLSEYDVEELGGAWYSHSGFSSNRNIEKLVVFGDYAVLRLQLGNMDFMLVDMSGKSEYTPGWAKK